MNVDILGGLIDALVPLLVAALLGGLVGWERENLKRPAGLRTHMMVALGSALFTQVGMGAVLGGENAGVEGGDPSRIITGIATGLGFLGAGTIIESRGRVQGLTTAAGLWVVGGIGVSAGTSQYLVAAAAAGLAVVILGVLPRVNSDDKDPERNVPPPTTSETSGETSGGH